MRVTEALDLLKELGSDLSDLSEDDDADVVFFPSLEEAGAISDEDSDLSDDGAIGDNTRLPRRDLRFTGVIGSSNNNEQEPSSTGET